MNTKNLIDKITDNWVVKILCVAAAILVYVFHQIAVLDRKSFTVPLDVYSDGLLVSGTEIPSFVKVSVRCGSDSIGAVTSQGFKAVLNLNPYTDSGEYDVPVAITMSEDMMMIDPLEVSVKPEYVSLTLDEKIEKYVDVQPSLSGEVSHGYVVRNIEVVPSAVKITGPKSIVEKTNHIYSGKVNVKGAATGFSTDVGLDNINRLVETHEEGKFKVTVSIEPAPIEKTFKSVVPSVVGLDGRFVNMTEIPAIDFTLAGTVPIMEEFSLTEENVFFDLSAVSEPGQYELPVLFSLPLNVSVKEKSYESQTLTVVENPDSDALLDSENGSENDSEDASESQGGNINRNEMQNDDENPSGMEKSSDSDGGEDNTGKTDLISGENSVVRV